MLRSSDMRRGFGRGLGENAQTTTPGGFGFGYDPWGLAFKPGVGRYGHASWLNLIGHAIFF
ncbi:hypothetical protein Hanom_Chr06g00550031 [Helianthus anomalus]